MMIDMAEPKKQLIRILQNAHAGELAAAYAYTGHGQSLFVTNKIEKKEILKIRDDELHHRKRLEEMLKELGAFPRKSREILMASVGLVIGFLCHFGGWFIPMYGAGKLESTNIFEYEEAAKLAFLVDKKEWIDELLSFAELEWDHELYFRNKTLTHFMAQYFPLWTFPEPKEQIRSQFETWKKQFN